MAKYASAPRAGKEGGLIADRGMRRVAVVLGVLLGVAAAVQLDDPDPWRWVAFYGASAAISIVAALRPIPAPIPAAMALVALGWLLFQAPSAVGSGDPIGEASRELAGQALVMIWMAILTFSRRR